MFRSVRPFCAAAVLLANPAHLSSQATSPRTAEERQALYDAHQADFDYLLGDWEFTAVDGEYGSYRGYWSAVRLPEGQILDEFRIVGDSGQTHYVTTTIRTFNSALGHWELVGMDAGGGLQDTGTGRRVGPEMHIEQRFGVAAGAVRALRIRYYNIRPDGFSWIADLSTDGMRSWTSGHIRIEARRIGPPRSLEPLVKRGGESDV